MKRLAISAKNISKQYRLGEVGTGTLSHDLNRIWYKMRGKEDPYLKIGENNDRSIKGISEYVWSLRDINFEINQGDTIGIIGRNGAGKSTLLKILSKVTKPTTGNIKVNGRMASLLEVGTGFNPEMTGRENIYLNGAILGMRRQEITRKLDEIIDFSGVERYIDTPVKRYSSGMYVRLAFAVAAHLESEILIVDEVLAVGDADFQKKCIGKMNDVSKSEGKTVLFVSHNLGSIRALCKNGILMKNGNILYQGSVNDTILKYSQLNENSENEKQYTIKYNNSKILIHDLLINNKNNNEIYIDEINSTFTINIKGFISDSIKIALELQFFDVNGTPVAFYCPEQKSIDIKNYILGDFEIFREIHMPKNLNKGTFYCNISLTYPNLEGYVDIYNAIIINSGGILTKSGNIFDYEKKGLIYLH